MLMTLPAAAQSVTALVGSRHYVEGEYNERNPGLLVRLPAGPVEVTLGGYHNSFGRLAVVAGASRGWSPARWLELRATAGVASGYKEMPSVKGVAPMLTQSVTVQPAGPVGVTVFHLPGAFGAGLTLSL